MIRYQAVHVSVLLLVVLASVCFHLTSANSNDPIDSNELGDTTRDCVAKYCPDFTSVDFWLDVKTVCYTDTSVKALSVILQEEEESNTSDSNEAEGIYISPHHVGLICASVAVVGLVAGYYLEEFLKKSRNPRGDYTPIDPFEEKKSLINHEYSRENVTSEVSCDL